jgi:hypothetical protein
LEKDDGVLLQLGARRPPGHPGAMRHSGRAAGEDGGIMESL